MQLPLRKKILIIILILIIIALAVGIVLRSQNLAHPKSDLTMRPVGDVADNIQNGSQNKIFAEELKQVGYSTFLHGKGPFTVFVPTDKAYANLPVNDQNLFTNDEGSLRQILLYNIIKGKYRLSDLRDGMKLHTIQGDDITVTKKGNAWVLDGYSYIQTYDVISKNGVIHLTTNYLIPPSLMH